MNIKCKKSGLANSILWAAAILSAAILKAPIFLTLIILPVLAFTSNSMLVKQSSNS